MTKLRDISNIETDITISVLVTGAEEKTDRNGNAYCVFELSDGETKISARCFGWDLESSGIKIGDVIEANIESSMYNGNITYKISIFDIITNMPGVNMSDFIVTAPLSNDDMDEEIKTLISKIQSVELQNLVKTIYRKYEQELVFYPAAKSHHHNYYGGLKYHMLCVAKNAYAISNTYDYVNKDVVIAGALLHDIGKLFEYDADEIKGAEYNVDGNLFGHLFIGAQLVDKIGKERNINNEVLKNLIHIILSHHDNPEWGAVKIPSTIEARIVASADYVDSQVEAMHQIVETTEPGQNAATFACGVKPYRPNF